MEETKKLIVLMCLLSVCIALKEIPPFLKICHKSNPDLKTCIIQSVEALRPQLQHGNPEYNIPSVEPIVINDLVKDTSGPMKLETTEVVAYGGGNYEIMDITPDVENHVFESDINVPNLNIEAKYRMDGKLVMLSIRGNGTFHANFTNCRAKSRLVSKLVQKDGETHLEFIENKMKITVGGGRVLLNNLFNGDKALSKMVNDAINDNLQEFIKEFIPYIERGLGKSFLETANQIVAPYTIEQLFPE